VPFSIVVPSRNIANLTACVKALRDAGETATVVAVWDGTALEAATVETEDEATMMCWGGPQPFCFARNINIGIHAAGANDDVILLNDDALLETPHGLSAMAAQWSPFGVLSARVRGPAHPVHALSQRIGGDANDITLAPFVPFVCVRITRECINRVGLLDEQFTPGSYEDNDYCRRVVQAGMRIGVYNACTVNHETLPHTFRPAGEKDKYDLATNAERYSRKWRPN
jgi:hypothetical protein